MLYRLPAALSAICLLSACTTTVQPSEPRIALQRPSECLVPCPMLPEPYGADELGVTLWTLDLIDNAGECRRMHEACRSAR